MDADKVFKALADPSRRKPLDLLCDKNGQTPGQRCQHLDMACQSATGRFVSAFVTSGSTAHRWDQLDPHLALFDRMPPAP